MEGFISSLESTFAAINLSSTDVILVDDFNAASSSWRPDDHTSLSGRLLEPAFLSLGLAQCVTSRTHLDSTGLLSSLLDLVLVSNKALVGMVDTLPPIGSSDHLPVLCQLHTTLSTRPSSVPQSVWCYDRADFTALNSALSKADWSPVSLAEDINSAWFAWLNVFLPLVKKHVTSSGQASQTKASMAQCKH